MYSFELLVDLLRGAAQGQLAQRGQVALAEEVLQRLVGPAGRVDLPCLHPAEQRVGARSISSTSSASSTTRSGSVSRTRDAGDALDDVGQALQVLDVDRGDDVDAGVAQDLARPASACACARAGGVGVGQLVDQRDLRAAGDDRVGVHLLERHALYSIRWRGMTSRSPICVGRLGAAVRLDEADDDVGARPPCAGGPRGAWRRSCRRRAPCRGRCGAGRAAAPARCRASSASGSAAGSRRLRPSVGLRACCRRA